MLPPLPGRTAVNLDTALAWQCTFPPRNLFSANAEVYIFPIFYLAPHTPHPTPCKLQQMIAPQQGHMFLIEFPHTVNSVRDVGSIVWPDQ
jgi:hypothetical protein